MSEHFTPHFTPAEDKLLRFMLANEGRRLTRKQMIEAFTTPRDAELERNLVNVTVCRIRAKLARMGSDFQIMSLSGRGRYFLERTSKE